MLLEPISDDVVTYTIIPLLLSDHNLMHVLFHRRRISFTFARSVWNVLFHRRTVCAECSVSQTYGLCGMLCFTVVRSVRNVMFRRRPVCAECSVSQMYGLCGMLCFTVIRSMRNVLFYRRTVYADRRQPRIVTVHRQSFSAVMVRKAMQTQAWQKSSSVTIKCMGGSTLYVRILSLNTRRPPQHTCISDNNKLHHNPTCTRIFMFSQL